MIGTVYSHATGAINGLVIVWQKKISTNNTDFRQAKIKNFDDLDEIMRTIYAKF